MTDLQDFRNQFSSVVEYLFQQWKTYGRPTKTYAFHVCTPDCKKALFEVHCVCLDTGNIHICGEEFCDAVQVGHDSVCPVTGFALSRRLRTVVEKIVVDLKFNPMSEEVQTEQEDPRVREVDEYTRRLVLAAAPSTAAAVAAAATVASPPTRRKKKSEAQAKQNPSTQKKKKKKATEARTPLSIQTEVAFLLSRTTEEVHRVFVRAISANCLSFLKSDKDLDLRLVVTAFLHGCTTGLHAGKFKIVPKLKNAISFLPPLSDAESVHAMQKHIIAHFRVVGGGAAAAATAAAGR